MSRRVSRAAKIAVGLADYAAEVATWTDERLTNALQPSSVTTKARPIIEAEARKRGLA